MATCSPGAAWGRRWPAPPPVWESAAERSRGAESRYPWDRILAFRTRGRGVLMAEPTGPGSEHRLRPELLADLLPPFEPRAISPTGAGGSLRREPGPDKRDEPSSGKGPLTDRRRRPLVL